MPSAAVTAARALRRDRQLSEQRQKATAAGWFRRLPFALRVLLPLGLLAVLGYQGWQWWQRQHVRIAVALPEGAAPPATKLEFFAWSDSGAAISPPPKLGEREWSGDVVTVGADLVPGAALMRITAPGFGADYALLELGQRGVTRIALAPPRQATGRVVDARGQPVAGARVIGFGGREHGVPLAESVTAADGTFTLQGFAPKELLLRVVQPGFALGDALWADGGEPPLVELAPAKPVRGRVVLPAELRAEGVTTASLTVQAFRLPGADAAVAADGTFVLEHPPAPPGIVRLVLPQLPAGWTHRATVVQAGDEDVVLTVCRAAVVEGQAVWENGQPAAFAAVLHEHGPTGNASARCDADGRFRIERVPPGEVTLDAVVMPKPRRIGFELDADMKLQMPDSQRVRSGSTTLDIVEGESKSGVRIRLD